MKRVLAAIVAGLIAGAALAHEFYDSECCSGSDCQAAKDGEVVQSPGGWLIIPLGIVVPYDKTRTSPDGKFHYCQYGGVGGAGGFITASGRGCLYVPAQSF